MMLLKLFLCTLIFTATLNAFARTDDTPTISPTTEPSTRPAFSRVADFSPAAADEIRRAGKALIDDAVKKPYGWGWEKLPSLDPAIRRAPPVGMSRRESPAAGLVLLWAGTTLNDSTMIDAANQAARGVAFSLAGNGSVLSEPKFGANAGGHDDRAYVPPRMSTIAGLALLLVELDGTDDSTKVANAQFHSAAVRATTWLIHQQAHNGSWPTGFPPGAGDKDAVKIVRLDSSDFRDATIVLFAAGEILHLQVATDAAKKSADFLTRTRLASPVRSSNLWPAACTIDGEMVDESLTFPSGADSLASRDAIQTLLVASCFENDEAINTSIDRAVESLKQDQLQDETNVGKWERYPDPGAYHKPATRRSKAGVPTQPAVKLPVDPGDFGIAGTLKVAASWMETDRAAWLDRLSNDGVQPSLRARVLATCVGLIDDPFDSQTIPRELVSTNNDDPTIAHRIGDILKPLLSELVKERVK